MRVHDLGAVPSTKKLLVSPQCENDDFFLHRCERRRRFSLMKRFPQIFFSFFINWNATSEFGLVGIIFIKDRNYINNPLELPLEFDDVLPYYTCSYTDGRVARITMGGVDICASQVTREKSDGHLRPCLV